MELSRGGGYRKVLTKIIRKAIGRNYYSSRKGKNNRSLKRVGKNLKEGNNGKLRIGETKGSQRHEIYKFKDNSKKGNIRSQITM